MRQNENWFQVYLNPTAVILYPCALPLPTGHPPQHEDLLLLQRLGQGDGVLDEGDDGRGAGPYRATEEVSAEHNPGSSTSTDDEKGSAVNPSFNLEIF